ncbi:type II toxin-antitoxin system RelE/ParE family toxin [Methylobacterium sp. ARG-1]|uniref:type II toxin-antitoxin system RelE/ParE family toxin n=1 Tax=Methylobacterium sp. ARG-1 TaxID=1692501 RepID=UPI0009E775D4|nr:type II toxin-antitoxin system RelE/ParE family toxin [Methylobacterium sp. ARG-1]
MPIRPSAAARRDLSSIWAYSAKRWDEDQADRYVRSLAESFDSLERGALKGRSVEHVQPGYFALAVGSHRVFYRHGRAGVIEIMRIPHQRMDVGPHP